MTTNKQQAMEEPPQKALTMEEKAEAAMKRLEEILAMPGIEAILAGKLPDEK